jgi:mannose/fructose/N-acetylgalactosamine-specific phosphotransferase system component IIB
VANDRVAGNDWERRLYTASVPSQLAVSFLTVEDAARRELEGHSVVLLFESVADLHGAFEAGAHFEEVNVGGLHYHEGAREVLPFVYLSDDDRSLLKNLLDRGVRLIARDIPGNPAVDLKPLLLRGGTRPSGGI